MFDLIVVSSFADYDLGARLSGDGERLSAIAEKYPHNVIKVARASNADLVTHMLAPEAPAPKSKTK